MLNGTVADEREVLAACLARLHLGERRVVQAMLYVGQQFDWNIGSGGFWLFSTLDGEWTETARFGNWIS